MQATPETKPRICQVAIIDDSEEDRYVIRRHLLADVETRYVFREAETGAQGIELCRGAEMLDCVLLDLSLPGMNGIEVIEALKDSTGRLPLPIVVLTGSDSSSGEGRAALGAGAQDFLGKAWITPQGLSRAIANAMERFQLARRIEDRDARLRLFIENAPAAIAMFDREMRYVAVSRRWTDDFLPGVPSVIGRCHYELFPNLPEHWQAAHRRGLAGEVVIANEDEYPAKKGHWHRWEVHPWRAPDGTVGGILLLTQDITEQKRAEAALRQYAEQLKEADARKNDFLATLSHELRNSLAPIRNAVALLKKPNFTKEQFEFARDIADSQVDMMVRLIDDLLDVSRISQGKITLKKERVELQSILDQAIETSRPHIEESGHELTVELPKESIYLEADRLRLAQVFGNLLNNACKYSERNGRITLRAELAGISEFGIRRSDLSDFKSAINAVPTFERGQGLTAQK